MKRNCILKIALLALVMAISGGQTAFSQETGEAGKPVPAETAKTDLDLSGVIAGLQENYKEVDSYKAGFEQEIFSIKQGRVLSEASGTVIYKKPGKMVWRYEKPEEHLYIASGNTIWDYSPKEKEVYVLPMKDALYKSFLLGLGNISEDFEVSFHSGRKMNSDGLYQLDLVPKNEAERETLGVITLYVDPETFLVKKTQMTDSFGNRNRIAFKDMETNVELADAMFEFEPPPGVTVIRADEAAPME